MLDNFLGPCTLECRQLYKKKLSRCICLSLPSAWKTQLSHSVIGPTGQESLPITSLACRAFGDASSTVHHNKRHLSNANELSTCIDLAGCLLEIFVIPESLIVSRFDCIQARSRAKPSSFFKSAVYFIVFFVVFGAFYQMISLNGARTRRTITSSATIHY